MKNATEFPSESSAAVDFIRRMPKVELHVHLEGSIKPALLCRLAERNRVDLPYQTASELERWFEFTDFSKFIEVYLAISSCLCTADDIELIAREFLRGQADQNIVYSEVIFTPYTHFKRNCRIPFGQQIGALDRARRWAEAELGIQVRWVLDVSRNVRPVEHALQVVDWAIAAQEQGVVGFGLGGPEKDNPPELFEEAFARARSHGLASLPHAGETEGPASIWGAVERLGADRIGHGVRCLEDPHLVETLCQRRIPLDVSLSSNVCLKVVPRLAEHPLPKLLKRGLIVTLNSDDPPLFNTTLTDEFLHAFQGLGLRLADLENLVQNAVAASTQNDENKTALEARIRQECSALAQSLGIAHAEA